MMADNTQDYLYFGDVNVTYVEQERSRSLDNIILLSVLPVEIIVGVLLNSWALAVIIRRRLWIQHEGFVYLGAILLTSALILAIQCGSYWFSVLDFEYTIARKADFLCKSFQFLFNTFHSTGLLVIALLFNVCLRKGFAKREEGEKDQMTPYYRPSICALIVALSLIVVTLVMNIGHLLNFELQEYYDERRYIKQYYCGLVDDWYKRGLHWNWLAAILLHGLPVVFILPVLAALIGCSGCACTGCKFGDNSREHFPRAVLLSLAGIIYFLEFPSSFWVLFGHVLFGSYAYHVIVTYLYVVAFLVNGFVLAVLPILCIVAMPKFREATFKADCCRSCGHSQTLDIEAIALRQAGQEN